MAELLLELFSEEIPARMQPRAEADLKRLLGEALKDAGLGFKTIDTYSTPRRLAAHVTGLPAKTADISEERRGPKVGAPEKAVAGFSKGTGVEPKALKQKDGYYYAKVERKGQETSTALVPIIEKLLFNFPWPKSQRWGRYDFKWVRPLRNVLALFNHEVVKLDLNHADIWNRFEQGNERNLVDPTVPNIQFKANNKTFGHRFLAPAEFPVKDFVDYKHKLNQHYVMLDTHDRIKTISAEIIKIEKKQGLEAITSPGLLAEVAGLVEWPMAHLGSFDKAFLGVPPEALISEMQYHQKYFPVRDPKTGKLANKFIFVANMVTEDKGKAITEGNQRVLSARLYDAKFFWDQDRKIRLEDRLPKLKGITFHEKLGSVADRVERIEKLAGKIAGFVPKCDPKKAKRAAHLAKADLVSGMVGEFPELQGIMGYYYAREQGEGDDIANAIRDQYSPKGPDDDCPKAPVSVALALAENIEKLVSFWGIDEKPTGSKDPFALRRAALSAIRLIVENNLRIRLKIDLGVSENLLEFFADRLKVQQKEQGVRHDLIDAVFSLGGEDDLVRLLARVHALQDFLKTDDGDHLLAGYKRAVNIVRIEEKKDGRKYSGKIDAKSLKDKEEISLYQGLETARKIISKAIEAENFEGAMRAIAKLRKPVDNFFDHVTVNVDDPKLRKNRLKLLAGIRIALLPVADFSKISG